MRVVTLRMLGDNYAYLLESAGEAVVVDPADGGVVLKVLRAHRAELRLVLVTHHHFDHADGSLTLKRVTGCRLAGPADARLPGMDEYLADGGVVEAAGLRFETLALPGHTRTHVGYYAPACKAVWTGDCLFVGGCGRTFEGTPEEMWASLARLRALPDDTRVYCGHNYAVDNLAFALHLEPGNAAVRERLEALRQLDRLELPTVPSLIALEKATNPFLRVDHPDLVHALGLTTSSPARVFAELRMRKNHW